MKIEQQELFDVQDLDTKQAFILFQRTKTAFLRNTYWHSAVALYLVEKDSDFTTAYSDLEQDTMEMADLINLGWTVVTPAKVEEFIPSQRAYIKRRIRAYRTPVEKKKPSIEIDW